MTQVQITIKVEIVESDGHAFTVEEASPNVSTGGNPLFFAQDAERGVDQVAAKVQGAIAARFGDVRTRGRSN